MEPIATSADIRADAQRFLRSTEPAELVAITPRLREFAGQVAVVWGMRDISFRPQLGKRLAALFDRSEFVEVPDSGTLVAVDAPAVLAEHIRSVAR